MYIAILGRQPALGMAELEKLYGAGQTRWFSDQSALIETDDFSVQRVGGTQKAGRVVAELPHGDWRRASMKIVQAYTQAWAGNDSKITLGISAYGFDVSPREIQKTGIVLKQKLKVSGASLRLVPNAEAALNTATSHHNKLGLSQNKVELLVVRARNGKIIVAESTGAQNITAYTKRDQERPKRDAFVGMLPPKLAQMMINLAAPASSSSPSPLPPPPGRSTGDGTSARGARLALDGDIPSVEEAEMARQTRSEAASILSHSVSASAPARVARGGAAPSSSLSETKGRTERQDPRTATYVELPGGSSDDGSGQEAEIRGRRDEQKNKTPRLLDPFCGTGVVLQEAALMGYSVYGTDLSDKMIDFSQKNLQWLADTHHITVNATLHQGDAMETKWKAPIDAVACESYLGQPFSAPPSPAKLAEVRKNCDYIISGFLKNIAKQIAPGTPLCIGIPAWRASDGSFTHLPLNNLENLGFTLHEFKNVKNSELLYYREDQIVARELLVLTKS